MAALDDVKARVMNPLATIPGSWRLFIERTTGDEIVDWAVRALDLGFDTQHLRQLASFDTPVSRIGVQTILRRALRELGAEVWTEEQARRHHLVEIAVAMARRELPVDEGLREIHRTVLSPLNHPKDLQVWCDLSDGFLRSADGSVTVLDPTQRDAVALAEAEKLAESGGGGN